MAGNFLVRASWQIP